MTKLRAFAFIFLILLTMYQPHGAHAQGVSATTAIFGPPKKEEVAPPAPAIEIPKDPLGRETPRGMFSGFLSAIGQSDYAKASGYMNLSGVPKSQAEDYAKNLQTLMNNAWITPASMLSDDPLGNKEDGLAEGVEKFGTLKAKNKTADLTADKIVNPDGVPVWVISNATVKQIPLLIRNMSESKLDRVLPDRLLEPKFWGVPFGHWIAMLGLVGAAYLVSWFIVRGLVLCTRKCWKNTNIEQKHVIDAFEVPVRIYLAVWLFVISSIEVGVSIIARQYFSHITILVAWISLALLVWKLIDVIAEVSQKKLILKGKYGALSGVQFFRRTAKFIFIAVALFVTLDTIGIDVTAGLAALGIGGLAIAFGAQKTVENFIGSIMVIFDQPIRIGDYCKVGDITGTIEDIGMRSTRIRTLNRTVITIPNGDFSSQRIENYAQRDQFRLYQKLAFRMDAGADQLRFLVTEIRALLYSHPKIETKSANVKFIGWGDYSHYIELTAYVVTRNNDEFLEVQEDMFLRIMDIIAASGATLTTPATPFAQYAQPEDSRQAARATAEQKIRDSAAKGDLPLPKFDPAKIDSLKGTLDYPAKGSQSFKSKKE